MRSGNWRGVAPALGLACALAFAATAGAQDFHTIPRLVPAVDLNTGGPYYAPPIPYGHYAGKNLGGRAGGLIRGCFSKLHGACGLCGGKGCGACAGKNACGLCGGAGCDACGGGGHGHGLGHGHGHGLGNGSGLGGLFQHRGGGLCDGNDGCRVPASGVVCEDGRCGKGGGLFPKGHGHGGHGLGHGHASTVVVASGQGVPTPQAAVMPAVAPAASGPVVCEDPGCGLFGKHRHKGCGLCGGKGWGCRSCAVADPCGACGGKGCGLCGGGKGLCGLCGGKGCAACAHLRGLLGGLLGRNRIEWFTGPGGPVPLTPGYTPYVVTTRAPRDFLAFPPFVP
jgi:hypothetical protein